MSPSAFKTDKVTVFSILWYFYFTEMDCTVVIIYVNELMKRMII